MSILITKNSNSIIKKNYLAENLCYLIRKNGIDAGELSQSTGIALTTINSLKRGLGNPTLSTLQTISNFFKIKIGQLTEVSLSDCNEDIKLIEIPVLELKDIQRYLIHPQIFKSTISIRIEKHIKSFAVKISNNSMAPFFEKGTIFVVCSDVHPQDGDIVLVQFNKQTSCFRKIFIEDETSIFTPISELIGNEIFKSKNYVIHGIVMKAIQNFHEY